MEIDENKYTFNINKKLIITIILITTIIIFLKVLNSIYFKDFSQENMFFIFINSLLLTLATYKLFNILFNLPKYKNFIITTLIVNTLIYIVRIKTILTYTTSSNLNTIFSYFIKPTFIFIISCIICIYFLKKLKNICNYKIKAPQ